MVLPVFYPTHDLLMHEPLHQGLPGSSRGSSLVLAFLFIDRSAAVSVSTMKNIAFFWGNSARKYGRKYVPYQCGAMQPAIQASSSVFKFNLSRAKQSLPKIVRGSSSFVINADSCVVKVQGFIYFTLTFRISPPHLTSLAICVK
jgi:hypothetical protein